MGNKLNKLTFFQDRLVAREIIDRWGFLLFALVGSGGILLAKSFEVEPVLVAAGASLCMVAYAIIAGFGSTKLQADQAGDNCYYLGLIYTLASLSFAIFTFDPANTATTIVQGFGVALATTIMGLILRVFFSQSRVDLVDTEESARIALAEAASQVRSQLDGAVQALSSFAHQTQQHLQELRDSVETDLKAIANSARVSIETQSEDTVSETRKVTTAVNRLVSSLEKHADALSDIEVETRGQLVHLQALASAASGAKAAMSQVSLAATAVQADQQVLTQNSDRFGASADALAVGVKAMEQSAVRFDELVERRLGDLKRAPIEDTNSLEVAMRETMTRWSQNVDDLAARQLEMITQFEEVQTKQLMSVGRHNDALEQELARSRENVSRVHQALVDMTTELADRLESEPAQ